MILGSHFEARGARFECLGARFEARGLQNWGPISEQKQDTQTPVVYLAFLEFFVWSLLVENSNEASSLLNMGSIWAS